MDNNNLVNIDDLVRQRLGGGEEQERSGAWLHMRELLDEEMPQRGGFVYWRRMLSASAVLLLIATISVGGYELSASRNGNTSINNPVAIVAPKTPASNLESKTAPKAIGDHAIANEINNNNITSSGITANSNVVKTNSSDDKKSIAADTHLINKPNQHNHLAAGKKKTINRGTGIGNLAQNNDYLPLIADDHKGKQNNPVAANTQVKKSAVNNKADENEKAISLASAGTVKDDKTNTPATGKPAEINSIGKPAGDDKRVTGLTKKANHKTTGATATVKTAKNVKMKELALAGHPLSVGHSKAAASAILPRTLKTTGAGIVASLSKTSHDKLPLSSHPIANKKNNGIAANTVQLRSAKVLAVKNEKKIAGGKNQTIASSVAKAQKPVAGNLIKAVKPVVGIAGKNSVENIAKDATAANEKKEKRVIQKLVLYEQEHYIKTDPGNGYFNLDTVDMKIITRELAATEENNPAPPVEEMPAERKSAVAANNGVASSGNSGGNTSTTEDAHILPGASAASSGKPAMGQKVNSAASTSTTAGALGSLESAFNDVKYNVKGAQFAAGLTAGINGTFFGPSSFNGFQFGVTGDFAFSNEWSFASELKYFQRANNNYSLNDNYTTYTPNTGGGYTVTQTTNAYSFTALHSIEMPLIIRYTNGKFNFFVGGNLVYSFSINEGYAQQTPVVTTAPAMGADTQPKINPAEPQSDFNSRFGVGCLFGISYKIAPNFNIDLRNVMTLWDNSSSQGAKYVSDQVYKSPSLQLSLGYRLGNNKHKE